MCRTGIRGERCPVFQYDSCPQRSGFRVANPGHAQGHWRPLNHKISRGPNSGRLQRGRPGSVKLRLGPITGGQQVDAMLCVFVWSGGCTKGWRHASCFLLLALPSLLDSQLGFARAGRNIDAWCSTLGIKHPPLAPRGCPHSDQHREISNPRTASLGHERRRPKRAPIPACNARD